MPVLGFIGGVEIVIVILAVLLLFGADKIPEMARFIGKGMNEVKKATDEIKKEINDTTGGVVDETKKLKDDIDKFTKS